MEYIKEKEIRVYLNLRINQNKNQIKKIIVQKSTTVAQLLIFIRRKIKLKSEQAIFIIVNDTMPIANQMIGDLYETFKNKDGGLDILCQGEDCFGFSR